MINSPSLTLTTASSKPSKASSVADVTSRKTDFGQAFEGASKEIRTERKHEASSSKATEKDNSYQEDSIQSSDQQNNIEKTAENADKDNTQASHNMAKGSEKNEPSSSEAESSVNADPSGHSETAEMTDGNGRQAEGQDVAVEGEDGSDVEGLSPLENSLDEDNITEADVEALSTSDQAGDVSDEQPNLINDASSAIEETNNTEKTGSEASTSIAQDVTEDGGEALEAEGNDSNQGAGLIEADDEAQSVVGSDGADVENDQDLATSVSGAAQQPIEEVEDLEGVTEETSQTASLDGESDDVLPSDTQISSEAQVTSDIKTSVDQNDTEEVAASTLGVTASTTTDASSIGAAKGEVASNSASMATNSGDGKQDSNSSSQSNNLRWIMDQLEQRANKPLQADTPFKPTGDQAFNSELSSSLSDVNLLEEDMALPEDFSEIFANKKPLDQLMSSISAQMQQLGTANSNSPLTFNSAFSGLSAARPEGAAAQLTMHSLPDSSAWATEMSQKVSWVAKEGIKTAHIRLDPPELGSLTVKVTMDADSNNTHVSFVASSHMAKDALEGQMQRLRDMLQQQGIDLDSVDVEVSQGNDQAYGSESFADGDGQEGSQGGSGLGDLEGEEELENMGYIAPAEQGIDYYA